MAEDHVYIAIDLKSFYASVECVERGLDPLTTHLVVADESRTEKTICLAVSPSLKAYGIPGRARLFEVLQKLKEINAGRERKAPGRYLYGESYHTYELEKDPTLRADMLIAPPRMAHYMDYSAQIYGIYLKYVAPEDIHVYSIDEVFIDATPYLNTRHMSAREFAMTIIQDVLKTTGITATAGIGPNLYLSKVAMDIVAKHIAPDADGVRIAELNEKQYREMLWDHQPITDFWRVGRGYARRLAEYDMYTMGDVALCSHHNEDLLYEIFGVNAELLIDHAWGWEPCTIKDIKAYVPENNSLGTGQILPEPYTYEQGRIIVREMFEALALELVDKRLVTDQIIMTIGYDKENIRPGFQGDITKDYYGRRVPKQAHGSYNLGRKTSSGKLMVEGALTLYEQIVRKDLMIRRINITANHILPADSEEAKTCNFEQLDLFSDFAHITQRQQEEEAELIKEKKLQETMLSIKKKYGKNAVLKGTSYQEKATAKERNETIGGHKA